MPITFEKVDYSYQPNTPFEHQALQDINLTIADNSFTALIGHTGSGKSTLIQQMNALLKPSSGVVRVNNREIRPDTNNKDLKPLRKQVGMVFQFPENQLFEETVKKDIMFGPLNFGMSEAEAEEEAIRLITEVGLDESLLGRSPFELSGGQMRRVAIAGVLASKPDILILDEPTSGLDPKGRQQIMDLVAHLHENEHKTIILVTHQMEDVTKYADRVIVMDGGRVAKTGTPKEIFNDVDWLKTHHLDLPKTTQFAATLQAQGFQFPEGLPLDEMALAQAISQQISPKGASDHG